MIYVEPTPSPAARFGLLEAAALQPGTERWQMGVQFEPTCGIAHLTVGACIPAPLAEQDVGDVTINVNTARVATLNGPVGAPGDYVIDWGDGSTTTGGTLTNRSHTYTANGTYDVTVTGPGSYSAAINDVTVTNGSASGPFTGDALDATPASKDADWDSTLVEADPFAVYHLAECRAVGGAAGAEARAVRSFEQAEGRAVEEWFSAFLSADTSGVDLTPAGGAVSVKEGLGILEGWAGLNYGGTPVVHGDRQVVSLLGSEGAVGREGSRLETVLGSRVAAGGGYVLGQPGAGNAAVADGTAYLYVTGQVVAWRGEPFVSPAPLLQRGTGGGYLNDFLLLVERPYVLATECIIGGVLVQTVAP